MIVDTVVSFPLLKTKTPELFHHLGGITVLSYVLGSLVILAR